MSDIGVLCGINRHLFTSPQKILYNIICTQAVIYQNKYELRMSGCMAPTIVKKDLQQKLDYLKLQHLQISLNMAMFTHVVCTGVTSCGRNCVALHALHGLLHLLSYTS